MKTPQPSQSAEDKLDDIRLEEDVESEARHRSTRPECLSGPVQEVLLVFLAAFIGSTFLALERTMMLLTDTVRHSLGLTMSATVWMVAGPGLTGAVFLMPISHIADRCPNPSRKFILIASILLFSFSIGLSALLDQGICLDIMLGLAGMACAAHIPIMSSLLTSIYSIPSTRRHCVFTCFMAGGSACAIFVGGLGSGLVDVAFGGDWQASFVYIAVFYALVAVAGVYVIPDMPRTGLVHIVTSLSEERFTLLGRPVDKRSSATDWWLVLKSFDWVTIFILFTGTGCLSAALVLGPELHWKSPWVFLPLTYTVMMILTYLAWVQRMGDHLIPDNVWKNTSVVLIMLSTLCTSVAFFSSLFWITFFMQDIQKLQPLDAAIRLLPQALTGLGLSPLVGCWMHKIDNLFILMFAAMCQVVACVLLLFLHQDSSYFALVFPSLILNTLSMDWVRNIGAQYVTHILPLQDHVTGTAILQMITRLGIPLGIGITTSTWSSYNALLENPPTKLNDSSAALDRPYWHAFIIALCFAALALVLTPFTRLGKLGIASTITGSSLPYFGSSGLKNINYDGTGDYAEPQSSLTHSTLTRLPSADQIKRHSRFEAQSHRSSRETPNSINSWRRSSTGITSSKLSSILDSRASKDASRLRLSPSLESDMISRRTSTAMAERVIWLVCEDCGASKRMVEPVGDPERYFYDDGDNFRENGHASPGPDASLPRAATPVSSSSESLSSSASEIVETSVADVGVVVSPRRFALVDSGTASGAL